MPFTSIDLLGCSTLCWSSFYFLARYHYRKPVWSQQHYFIVTENIHKYPSFKDHLGIDTDLTTIKLSFAPPMTNLSSHGVWWWYCRIICLIMCSNNRYKEMAGVWESLLLPPQDGLNKHQTQHTGLIFATRHLSCPQFPMEIHLRYRCWEGHQITSCLRKKVATSLTTPLTTNQQRMKTPNTRPTTAKSTHTRSHIEEHYSSYSSTPSIGRFSCTGFLVWSVGRTRKYQPPPPCRPQRRRTGS